MLREIYCEIFELYPMLCGSSLVVMISALQVVSAEGPGFEPQLPYHPILLLQIFFVLMLESRDENLKKCFETRSGGRDLYVRVLAVRSTERPVADVVDRSRLEQISSKISRHL